MYDFEKITSLFSNADTISFVDLLFNYKELINIGYSEQFWSKLSFNAIIAFFSISNDVISGYLNNVY